MTTENAKQHTVGDGLGYLYAWLSIGMTVAVCLFIIINVFWLGIDVISLDFLTKPPSASALSAGDGGILTPMAGTLLLTIIGICIALPLALSTAIYLFYYAKKGIIKTLIETAVDVLSGIPTVVIALFAVAVFTRPWLAFLSVGVGDMAYGKSFLVAGATMAVMILPFVAKSILEAFKTVPPEFAEGSYALGASKWRTISKVSLKSARQGVISGSILGMGRIIGDTAIVWLALGGTLRMTGAQPWFAPQNWLSTLRNTGSTLTSYIYYASPAGEGSNFSVAFGASAVLIVIIILLNAAVAAIGSLGGLKHD